MKQKPQSIQRNIRALRTVIDTTTDPILKRLAYEMQTAVRWATEDTVGWPGLAAQARDGAKRLHDELAELAQRYAAAQNVAGR